MKNDLEVKGEWWLPERAEKKVTGILKFSAEHGAELDLLGTLRTPLEEAERTETNGTVRLAMTETALERSGRYPRLHGQAGAMVYTLEDCFRTRATSNLFRLQGGSESIRVNRVLQGAIFEEGEPLDARGISFGMAHLNDWIMETGIKESWHFREDEAPLEEGMPRLTLEAFEKPDRKVITGKGRTVSLQHGVGIEGDLIDRRSLTQTFSWRIDSGRGKCPQDDLLDWAGDLQSLVSTASCRTSEYNFVRFWHPDVERRLGDARTVP